MTRLSELADRAQTRQDWHAAEANALVRAVRRHAFGHDPEYRRYGQRGHHPAASATGESADSLLDFLFATSAEPHLPNEVFDRLRWGGLFVFVSDNPQEILEVSAKFRDRRGFIIEHEPGKVATAPLGLSFLGKTAFYFSARKVYLIQPGQMSDRFTYNVHLVRCPDPSLGKYAVLKQIPDFDSVIGRLRQRLPEASLETITKGARKLVDKVFPVFLTREAAFLNILKRDLPPPFNERVPRVIDLQKDSQGFVRKLYLQWLRNGRDVPLTQLEFARQSAELLEAFHDKASVIHLDLRLDNFVVTEAGVGFVDLGSAVRVGENLAESPMLRTLFDEMMQTSQIQRDLGKMMRGGKVTSRMIVDCHEKVDKAVDLFYLALQMNDPHSNPDFAELVEHDPQSPEAVLLRKLTVEILKPADPENPPFRSASDIVRAIAQIEPSLPPSERRAATTSRTSPGGGLFRRLFRRAG